MVDKIKFIIKVTAKIPAWRQGNVPFPSARFWHNVVLLRHAMQTYVVMSALDCVAWALQSLTALRGALCPRPRVHTLGPPSVTSDIRERERGMKMREMQGRMTPARLNHQLDHWLEHGVKLVNSPVCSTLTFHKVSHS